MLNEDQINLLLEIGERHVQELMGIGRPVTASCSDHEEAEAASASPANFDAGCSGSEPDFDSGEVGS